MSFRSTKGASKQRRDLINHEVSQLKELLPMSTSSRNRLSQLQVMAVISVYIRKSKLLTYIIPGQPRAMNDVMPVTNFTQVLDGFLVAMTHKGQILYISENVSDYLGYTSIELMSHGDTIFDLIDNGDHTVIESKLADCEVDDTHFYLKMIISKGYRRQSGLGEYKLLNARGHFVKSSPNEEPIFVGVFRPCMTSIDNHLNFNEPYKSSISFSSMHSLDMNIHSMCEMGRHYLGIKHELTNESWYNFIHPEDILIAAEKHKQLLSSQNEMPVNFNVRLLVNQMNMMSPNKYLSVSVLLTRGTTDFEGARILCTYELLPIGGHKYCVNKSVTPPIIEDETYSKSSHQDIRADLRKKITKKYANVNNSDNYLENKYNPSYYTPLTPPSSVSSLNQPDSPLNCMKYNLPLTPEYSSPNIMLNDIQDTIDKDLHTIMKDCDMCIDDTYGKLSVDDDINNDIPSKRGRYDNLDDLFEIIHSLDPSIIQNEYLSPTL